MSEWGLFKQRIIRRQQRTLTQSFTDVFPDAQLANTHTSVAAVIHSQVTEWYTTHVESCLWHCDTLLFKINNGVSCEA